MKDNELLKLFIPLMAVVVIFESVLLVSNLTKKEKTGIKNINRVQVNEAGSSAQVIQNEPSAFELIFGTETKEMSVGKKYSIELNMLGKNDYYLGGMDLYVKFDPTAFSVSNLTYGNNFPKPTYSKISQQKGVVVANYLISAENGFKVAKDQLDSMVSFDVIPKKAGNFNFEITTGNQDKESATMFIESSTSKVLPFSSNVLNVNVSNQ